MMNTMNTSGIWRWRRKCGDDFPEGPSRDGWRCAGPRLVLAGLLAGISVLVPSPAGADGRSPTAPAAVAAPAATLALPREPELIVRLFYGDRERLAQLVSRYDVFEYANHDEGYVIARLRPSEYQELLETGYRLEIDEAQTAQANRVLSHSRAQFGGIPGYPCYRTVEETYDTLARIAANYPGLASVVAIGPSWEKAISGGSRGYDLLVLVLSNKSCPGPKPRFFLMAEHHARELTTAETATRFAEELVSRYGVDPDVTWLLDYYEAHILPMANPDGRKWAEQGQWWRKNTDNTNGCTTFPYFGTDLNRNCDFKWGGVGSSDAACDEIYHGPSAFSEPENQAIRDYVRSLFPRQRGPADTDAAPATATGLFITLHSFAQLVLHAWGWTTNLAPNHAALETLGARFGFFNRYTVQPSIKLYPTTGTADEWAYSELGVAGYTIEMGTAFFEDCTNFESATFLSNRPALYYAFKACRQPYLDPAGPDVLQAAVSPATNLAGAPVTLTAVADASRFYGTTPAQPVRTIAAARFSVDDPSWANGMVTQPMNPADGSFDSTNELLQASIDTAGWSPGRHMVFLEAQDAAGNWGVPTAAFVWIQPLRITGTLGADGFMLQWPSVPNKFYRVLQSADLQSGFTVLAGHLPASPPLNIYTDTVGLAATRFYRIEMEQ